MRHGRVAKVTAIALPQPLEIQRLCQFLWLGALSLLLLASLSGCNKRYSDLPAYSPIPFKDYENQSVGRFKTSYLADQIDTYYRGSNPGPIGVTTFVNIDDLYTTSTFGRMLGEQLMSELAMRGYDVVELRHADALQFLSRTGEFALSRDLGMVRRERDLGGVVAGTYVVSPVRVYLNARLIDPSTSIVLSAGSVEMSKSDEIARMLRGGSLPNTLERIPVRHLGFSAYPLTLTPYQQNRVYDLEEYGGGSSPGGFGQRPLREALPPIIAEEPKPHKSSSAAAKKPEPLISPPVVTEHAESVEAPK